MDSIEKNDQDNTEGQDGQGNDAADHSHWVWAAGGGAFVVLTMVLVWAVLTFLVYPKATDAAPATGKAQATAKAEEAPKSDYDPVAARGQFGDMFGAANALFSGFAFTALIVSLAMQRKELSLQRKELKLQRLELALARTEFARQADALTEQSETMETQAQIELLAARIVGAGSMLQLWQAAAVKSDFGPYMAAKSTSAANGVRQAAHELEKLMAIAKGLNNTDKDGG